MMSLDALDIRLVRALSEPLPLTARPFAEIARRVDMSEQEVIERVRAWTEDGTIRRFGARVNHRSLGYGANGMSVWNVADEEVEEAADFMTRQPEVSHCYLRPRHPSWQYNLYAMIHGKSEEDVNGVALRIASHSALDNYRVLFSSRELKKSAPRYFAENEGQGADRE